jgi:hypothetical protein
MRKSIAVAVIAASAATASCSQGRSEGAGPTVSRNYQVGNFRQIEVAGPYDVEVRTGGNPGVSARGSQNLLEQTVVQVEGDKLTIGPKEHNGFFHFGWTSHGKASFVVTVPQLSGATIAGSGGIRVDRVNGNSFEGTVAGSGGVKAGTGKAQNAEYEIAGSGDVDAAAVAAQAVKVSIAGSGSVKAQASGTANVDITGSGDVDVTGGAKCSVSKNGSGDVRCS